MGSFSVWHWLVVIAIVAVPVGLPIWSARVTARSAQAAGRPVPSGIGGWLMLLAISLTLAPLIVIAESIKATEQYPELRRIPGGSVVVYLDVVSNLVLLVVSVVAVVLFWMKKRTFKPCFALLWALSMFVFVASFIVIPAATPITVAMVVSGMGSDLGRMIGRLLAGGIWVWYVFASHRVRNTFVH